MAIKKEMLCLMAMLCSRNPVALVIEFKAKEGIDALRNIWQHASGLGIEFADKGLIDDMVEARKWKNIESRKVHISRFDAEAWYHPYFQHHAIEGAKSIMIDRATNPLSLLFASRKSIREKTANVMIPSCIGGLNQDKDLTVFGLKMEGSLKMNCGLPQLVFSLTDDDRDYDEQIIIDAWSCRVWFTGEHSSEFIAPERFQSVVREWIFERMDDLTDPLAA